MKLLGSIGLGIFTAVLFAAPVLAAQPTVGLGTAHSYAVLGGSAITNTGPTTITGDVGLDPSTSVTGFDTVTLNGAQHVADAAALQAKNDLIVAYVNAAGRTGTTVPAELGGSTKKVGVYNSLDATFAITGTLTLDAEGNPDAVFIFQAGASLTTASNSSVSLINSAQACNVFWQVGSSATLGTTTHFKGNILALTSITVTTGATVDGSVLARNGAVTLDNNVITRAVCATALSATLAPTSTSSGGDQGSGLDASFMLIFAGLAAGAAFLTVRRIDFSRR